MEKLSYPTPELYYQHLDMSLIGEIAIPPGGIAANSDLLRTTIPLDGSLEYVIGEGFSKDKRGVLDEGLVVFDSYYDRIQALRGTWKEALAAADITEEEGIKNYDPILPRAKFELLTNEEQREQFRKAEVKNVITSIRERVRTAESRFRISIGEDGKLYNYDLSDEPLEEVYKRGVYVRKKQRSKDAKREWEELLGFFDRQKELGDTNELVGKKVITISGPGLVEETIYTENFVDIEEIRLDKATGERYVEYARYASPLKYDQYKAIALRINPRYFEGYDPKEDQIDAWFLRHPLVVDVSLLPESSKDIFDQYFAKDTKAMEEEIFQRVESRILPFAHYFIDKKLTTDRFDPVGIAEGYHGILVETEQQLDRIKSQATSDVCVPEEVIAINDFTIVASVIQRHTKESVQSVGAGCGNSSGFSFGSSIEKLIQRNSAEAILKNSVAEFGLQERDGICAECQGSSKDNHYHCPDCSKKYEDETEFAQEKRTKVCSCNFIFHC